MSTAENGQELTVQLNEIEQVLTLDPENEELLSLKKELEDLIAIEKGPKTASSQRQESISKKEPRQQPARKVGELVLAKWITGDHQYYLAKIASITGSADKPVFTVKFTEYNEVQTLQAHQLKDADAFSQVASIGKRKANQPIPPPPPTPAVPLSGTSTTEIVKKKAKPDMALESSKSSWQSFAQTGPKRKSATPQSTSALNKVKKGGSMFRTSEDGRVGVMTGPQASQAMLNNVKRGRHVFEREASEEDIYDRDAKRRSRSRSRSPRKEVRSHRRPRSRSRSRSRDRGYRAHDRRR